MNVIPRYRPALSYRDVWRLIPSRIGDPGKLEAAFARLHGYRHAVWFPYARVAIRAFLETLPDPSPEVILSPYNCVALGNALISAGRRPLYIDTGPRDFNQDSAKFLNALTRPEVGAGIAVSLWAIPFDTSAYGQARKPVLFDYALSALDKTPAPLRDKDAAVYSLSWGKPLGTVRGGMLCSQSETATASWRRWRQAAIRPGGGGKEGVRALLIKIAFSRAGFGVMCRFQQALPFSASLSGQDAAGGRLMPKDWSTGSAERAYTMAIENLGRAHDALEERTRQTDYYQARLSPLESEEFMLPPRISWLSHFPVRAKRRDEMHQHLWRAGIFTSHRLFDRLLPDYPWLKSEDGPSLSNARALTQETLHLPLFEGLGEEQQDRVCRAVESFTLR